MTTATVDVRPSASRFATQLAWLDSRHSFSFGSHHDPANIGHGLLIVSNDDRVAPGGGFGPHGHRDMEIVTWVLEGSLRHEDSTGTRDVIYPGLAQRMSAGAGIRHSEMNASGTEPVHFVQMWVVPDRHGIAPGYEQLDVNDALATGGLVPVASGRPERHPGAIKIHQAGATMWVGRLHDRESVTVPDARFVHLFVAHGAIELDDDERRPLAEGDAVRFTDAGPVGFASRGASEIIVWESDQEVQR